MKNLTLLALLVLILGTFITLPGCSSAERDVVVFSFTDQNGEPLEDVKLFFGGDLQPRASSTTDGTTTLDLTGKSPDMVFRKEGFTITSVLNRAWRSVSVANYVMYSNQIQSFNVDTTAAGSLIATISKANPGDYLAVYAHKGREVTGSAGYAASDGTLAVSFPSLPSGTYYLSAYPTIPEDVSSAFPLLDTAAIAISDPIEVIAGEEVDAGSIPMDRGGKELKLSVIVDPNLGALDVKVYGNVYKDQERQQWVADNYVTTLGPTVLDLPMTLPVNSDNLSTSSYEVISQVDDTALVGPWDYLRLLKYKSFNSQFEFDAASEIQDLSLTDFQVSGVIPANDTFSTDTYPVFTAQINNPSMEYLEVRLSSWQFDPIEGTFIGEVLEHVVQNYALTEVNLPYITGGLSADTVYQFDYIARDTTDSTEKSTQMVETSRNKICISTGTVAPSAIRTGTCTPQETSSAVFGGNPVPFIR